MAFKLALDSDHWPSPRMNSAVPVTMLAFTYQSRYALHKLLSSLLAGEEAAVAVESLGDVEVRQSDAINLHELKLHITESNLTERSDDLWKTLRIWSSHARENKITLPTTSLFLATTHELSAESSMLKAMAIPDRNADANTKITNDLTVIAEGGGSKTNAKAYADFLKLTLAQRVALVGRILLIPRSLDFAAVNKEIVRMASIFYHGTELPPDGWQKLIGWWDGKVVAMLLAPGSQPVRSGELKDFIQEHRDRCTLERPIECFEHEDPKDGVHGDNSIYLRQLDLIGKNSEAKLRAKRDYYRASLERDAWTRRMNSYARLLNAFDRQLVETWEWAKPSVEASLSEEQEVRTGAEFYTKIMGLNPVPLRSDMAPHRHYVTRGSFHLLANEPEAPPSIGWHPRFAELLANDTR